MSTTAGHDCLYEQSYPILLNDTMGRLMAAAGVRFEAINVAMGNTRVAPYSFCVDAHAGLDADLISWDMTMMVATNECGRAAAMIELFIRSASVLPKRPAVLLTDASPNQVRRPRPERRVVIYLAPFRRCLCRVRFVSGQLVTSSSPCFHTPKILIHHKMVEPSPGIKSRYHSGAGAAPVSTDGTERHPREKRAASILSRHELRQICVASEHTYSLKRARPLIRHQYVRRFSFAGCCRICAQVGTCPRSRSKTVGEMVGVWGRGSRRAGRRVCKWAGKLCVSDFH